MTFPLREAFKRVVDAVCEQRALPFMGAGVSLGAPYQPPDGFGTRPSSADLEDRLAEHLWNLAQSTENARKALAGALGKGFRGPKALKRLGLPWLAELVVQVEGGESQKLCEILQIERFRYLEPTPAHCYLAFLAREGLISEVITTNYDQCLEKAIEVSDSDPTASNALNLPKRIHVVTDYNSNSERFRDGGRPTLTVYKINGCVGAYNGDEASAKRIVLTDLDLQAWHGEGWAKRLFAERVGQKAVILTGFSGEEAQVRFSVAALCNELSSVEVPVAPQNVPGLPIAPFVHSFERELNRFQQQILYTWFAARATKDKRKELTAEKRLEFMQANAFTGKHRVFFREESRGLTADRFWEAIFMASWLELLRKELTNGPTGRFLARAGLQPDQLAGELCAVLFEGGRDRCPRCSLLALDQDPTGRVLSSPLARCLDAIRGRPEVTHPGCYHALRDQPLLLGLLLLFWAWSGKTDSPSDHFVGDETLGLRLPRDPNRLGLETWLASFPPVGRSNSRGAANQPLAFVQIALFDDLPPEPRVESIRDIRPAGEDIVSTRYGLRADVVLLLNLAAERLNRNRGSTWEELCEVLDSVVDEPWSWVQDHRRSYRDRTDPLGGS